MAKRRGDAGNPDEGVENQRDTKKAKGQQKEESTKKEESEAGETSERKAREKNEEKKVLSQENPSIN